MKAAKNEDAVIGHVRIHITGNESEYDVGTVELVVKKTQDSGG